MAQDVRQNSGFNIDALIDLLVERLGDRLAGKIVEKLGERLAWPGQSTTSKPNSGIMSERDAASVLRVSVQLLRKWRAERAGPRYVKLGKCVRYRSEDVESYLQSRQQEVQEGTPRTQHRKTRAPSGQICPPAMKIQ